MTRRLSLPSRSNARETKLRKLSRAARCAIEPLEQRLQFSVYASLNAVTDTITVTGDLNPNGDDADVIDLEVSGNDLRVETNGSVDLFPQTDFDTIVINAGALNDDIDVDAMFTGKTITINGGSGNDRLDVAQGTDDVDSNVFSDLTFNGQGDSDTVAFHDTLDGPSANVWTFTQNVATKSICDVTYNGTETIVVNASAQDNSFSIDGINANLTIHGGSGDETFNVAAGDIDGDLLSNVTLEGNGGSDTIVFDDTLDGANGDTYEITDARLTKAPNGVNRKVDFNGMESFTLNGSNQPSTYNVLSLAANMPSTINGGSADDTFNVADGDIEDDIDSNVTIAGNGGADTINFDDTTDTIGQDTYTVQQNVFSKDVREFNYSVEAINLTGSPQNDTFTLIGTPGNTTVTLNSGNGNDTFNLGAGDVGGVLTGFVIDGQGGVADNLFINDTTDTEADTYTVTSNTFSKTFALSGNTRQFLQYAGLESLTLDANGFDNPINVNSTLASTPVLVNGNGGSDTISVGGTANTVNAIAGFVTARGNGGTDTLNYKDSATANGQNYTLSSTLVTRTGAADVDYAGFELMTVDASAGADVIYVNGSLATTPMSVNGNGASDAFTVGGGDWDDLMLSNLTLNGGATIGDSVYINDASDQVGPADSYAVNASVTTKNSTVTSITYSGFEGYTLDAPNSANTITVNSSFAPQAGLNFKVKGNGGSDTINVVNSAANAFVTVDGGTELDTVTVNNDLAGTASARFDSTQDLSSLAISDGGTAVLAQNGGRVIDTDSLFIGSAGKLDLTDNDLIVDYTAGTQLGVVQAQVVLGRNNAAWNGLGITSSTAAANVQHNTGLGVIEASDYKAIYGAGATFDGQGIDTSAVLVKYTYNGDANFSGTVTFDDYVKIDTGFNTHLTGWLNGDFNYSGGVNFDDYVLIDTAFNTQGGTLARMRGGGSVRAR